jgi:hypothetical protein
MVKLKDFPNAKEDTLIMIVTFYREMHNRASQRARGRPCKCGVCRMAQRHLVEELGVDLSVDPSRFTRGSMEEAFQVLEMADTED